jgi:hypothetical protein
MIAAVVTAPRFGASERCLGNEAPDEAKVAVQGGPCRGVDREASDGLLQPRPVADNADVSPHEFASRDSTGRW